MRDNTSGTEPVHYLDMVDDRELSVSWLRMIKNGDGHPPSRVVVKTHTRNLAEDFAEFQHLYLAQTSLICVVLGRADKTDSGAELRLPALLVQERSAVLWVSDPKGVWWSPDNRRGPLAGSGPPNSLGDLVDALTIEDVFNDVVKRAREIPNATASPGLHVVSGYIEPAQVTATIWQTVPRLTAQGSVDPLIPREVFDEATGADGASFVVEGSRLGLVRRSAVEHAEHADSSARRLAGWSGLLGFEDATATRAAVEDAGRELELFADEVRETADKVAAHSRSAAVRSALHDELGLPPRAAVEPSGVADSLRTLITDELRAGRSLAGLASALRAGATQLTPGGSRQVEQQLDSAYPEVLDSKLREPGAFRLWIVPPILLPAVALAIGVCALLPDSFWLVGLAIGLLWVAVVARMTGSRPRVANESAVVRLGPVVSNGLAAAVGVGLARAEGWTAPVELTAPLTVVVVMGLTALALVSWRRAALEWRNLLSTEEALAAAEEIGHVLEALVDRNWRQADRLTFWSDAMRTIAGALDDTAAVLRRIAAEADPTHAEVENPLVSLVIADDLADLALEALTPCWDSVATRRELGRVGVGVTERVQTLFREYRVHLADNGVQTAPSFGRSEDNRESLITETLRRVPEIEAITRRTGREEMRQLCALQDLSELRHEAKDIRVIRYAPVLAQKRSDDKDTDAVLETCWTNSTLAAGIVRLVPLRGEVVRTYWPDSQEDV